jgi:hypothetical protein
MMEIKEGESTLLDSRHERINGCLSVCKFSIYMSKPAVSK